MVQVHPHACGDIADRALQVLGRAGSPPRVWGYQPAGCGFRLPGRFTPTRVGISSSQILFAWPPVGSPPRVWGYP